MDSKTKTMLGIIGAIVVIIALSESVDASETIRFSEYLNMLVQGQLELIQQNNALIDQNWIIIDSLNMTNQLLKGNSEIFVAGLTDRYDVLEYSTSSTCTFYDRLEREIKTETCPIQGLTKDAFNAIITGSPQN